MRCKPTAAGVARIRREGARLAAPASDVVGPCVGVSLGMSQVGTTGVLARNLGRDERDSAGKV
jgi:hypothetical protein